MSLLTLRGYGRTLLLVAMAVVMGSVCVSGGAEKPAALVGQWVFAEGYRDSKVAKTNVEMFSDGTGVVDGASMTWKVENKRLMILTSNIGIACDYKVSGYELTLMYDDDISATFVKKGTLEEYRKKKLEKISSYFTDSRNGQKYRTVTIGGKTWMAENLNYQMGNSVCYGDISNCEKYGRLYDWNTAKMACPSGWHLPSRQEWNELENAVGDMAGKVLKSTYGWNEDITGTDNFGFSALPGGLCSSDGDCRSGGRMGLWWSSMNIDGGAAYCVQLERDEDGMEGRRCAKEGRISVRCIADVR